MYVLFLPREYPLMATPADASQVFSGGRARMGEFIYGHGFVVKK
jgi:hypothetical protein